MRKQTKPFTAEIKPSRKPKSGTQKMSIWGKLDLRTRDDLQVTTEPVGEPATAVGGGQS
ncbi:hypothetical protein ABIE78_003675 [Sinorhizobium fredii]|uniref:Uncharacterized protein n=1 Tax=Sinorhizobium fredii (strain USDA 257) TaxID=1185652 RepID=I3X3S7_SINF2|nr:hypothetical protein [Sinorhizobium fredii]AFL50533.1 hypothetical protein USDA257_c19480 [Sinorhizobium fredii USDA 257]